MEKIKEPDILIKLAFYHVCEPVILGKFREAGKYY